MNRLTLRARLTIVYGGLLLLAGGVLLAVTYVLMAQNLPARFSFAGRAAGSEGQETLPLSAPQAANLRTLITQVEDEARNQALQSLLTQGSVALLLVTAAATALGWLIAGRSLQPLTEITATARRIAGDGGAGAARGLHERIALPGPHNEVKQLADTFDLMLERLDGSFDGQRRFVANASHELRTPLALNRSLVELAITRPDASADVRRLGEALLSVNERHERLIDGLLTLADSENEPPERTPIDLADVARHVLELAKTTTPVEETLHPAPTAGDPILLERLTQNLVENAIRHNLTVGAQIWVRTGLWDGQAVLSVANTGPVVPAYEIETLFQPFRRLRGERTAGGRGFGLGLSIVRAVARAHGGEANAVPREGGGLIVTVTLPPR